MPRTFLVFFFIFFSFVDRIYTSDDVESIEPRSQSRANPSFDWKINIGPSPWGLSNIFNANNKDVSQASNTEFGGLLNMFKFVSVPKPWWKGPNVCVEREEVDETTADANATEDDSFFTSSMINLRTCYQTKAKYECVQKVKSKEISKTMTVRYQCCYGYRLGHNTECEKIEMMPLIDTIRRLNGTEFLKIASEIEQTFNTRNLTVFLPSDKAFKAFAEKMLENNRVEILVESMRRRRRDVMKGMTMTDLILGHIADGYNEAYHNEQYQSMYKNSSLRLTYELSVDDEAQPTINCAKITSTNNFATNGIVHTLDKVLMPVTRSIMSIVRQTDELSTLARLLEKHGLADRLDGNETWTLLAPTNEAFEKLQKSHPYLMKKINKGDPCVKDILMHHLLGLTLCSNEIELGATGVKNALGKLLKLSQNNKTQNNNIESFENTKSNFYINEKIRVSESDVVATNGVVQIIEDVIVPESAISATSMLLKNNLTTFHNLLKRADMLDEMDGYSNVTFFVPTDSAIRHYLNKNHNGLDLAKFLNNNESIDDESKRELVKFLTHHIAPGALESFDFEQDAKKQTVDKDYKLRINIYSTMPIFTNVFDRATVDCARLLHFDIPQCSNVVHLIDRPLIAYKGTLLDRIRDTPSLSILYQLLQGTETEGILKSSENITFVGPVDEVFEKMADGDLAALKKNKKVVDQLLKQHTYKEALCCSGLHSPPWPFTNKVEAFNGQALRIRSNAIGSASITSCDHVAANGILHLTNKLMIPPVMDGIRKPDNSNVDVVLYGY